MQPIIKNNKREISFGSTHHIAEDVQTNIEKYF